MKFRVFGVFALLVVGIMPAFTQDTPDMKTLVFNEYSLTYPEDLADTLTIETYPGDPLDQPPPSDLMGWEAKYTQLTFETDDYYLPTFEIRLAHVADLTGYPEEEGTLAHLRTLLDTRPDPKTLEAAEVDGVPRDLVPTLPGGGAVQMLVGRAEYVETETFVGLRYITLYAQDTASITGIDIRWVFIGVSKDDSTYVWMEGFTNTIDRLTNDEDFTHDPEILKKTYPESLEKLNALAPEDFTLDLNVLDAILRSLTVQEQ